eukprot:g23212.t1
MWFSEQTVKIIWQNASLPELSDKRQDVAWLKGTARQILHVCPVSVRHRTLPSKWLREHRGCDTFPSGRCLCKGSLEEEAVVSVDVRPKQLHDVGFCALREELLMYNSPLELVLECAPFLVVF